MGLVGCAWEGRDNSEKKNIFPNNWPPQTSEASHKEGEANRNSWAVEVMEESLNCMTSAGEIVAGNLVDHRPSSNEQIVWRTES